MDPNPDGAVLGVHIMASLQVALTGFLLAIVIGIPLGLFMGWFRGFDKFMRPIFEILRPIPPVSWIPLTIIWMGIGLQAKAFIVFFSAFVPVLSMHIPALSSPAGADQCGQNLRSLQFYGVPQDWNSVCHDHDLCWHPRGPRKRMGTLVAAEMLAANAGLGYMILQGRQFARADIIILGIVVIGVIGVIFTSVLGLLEKKVLRWKR